MKKIFAMLFPSAGFVSISPARRTVDGALAYFNKALVELRAVKEHQDAETEKQVKIAAAAQAAAEEATAEAVRAARAIAKIEDFVL